MASAALEIFPAIDIQGGRCVRLTQGDFERTTTYSDIPALVARRWKQEGARWLHIVDLDGARVGRPSEENVDLVREIVTTVGLPVQFGGGVRSAEAVARMLKLGVARVVVGTAVAKDDDLAKRLFESLGERVAVAVDARDGVVAISGWQEHAGERTAAFVARMAGLGARRFICTDIARDGMLQGVDTVGLAEAGAAAPKAALIASGGVASLADLDALRGLRADGLPNLEGVIIGKALYAGSFSLSDALERVTIPGE